MKTLCRTIIEEKNCVKKLECLAMKGVDLSDVNIQLLASAVVRVKSVDISGIDLTTDQAHTLCQTIIEEKDLVLEHLHIGSSLMCIYTHQTGPSCSYVVPCPFINS